VRPIVTDGVAWSVCQSNCLSTTAEPIEVLFWTWTHVSPSNVSDGDPDPQCKGEF